MGYSTPFVYAGSIIMSTDIGLLMTVHPRLLRADGWQGHLRVSCAGGFLGKYQQALKTLAPNLDPHSALDGASTGLSHTQASPELGAIYGMATKDCLRVGLILATVSV